jgi:hypothetical protein
MTDVAMEREGEAAGVGWQWLILCVCVVEAAGESPLVGGGFTFIPQNYVNIVLPFFLWIKG